MLKFIKKINRGVILTTLVLTGVIVYLVVLSLYNASQRPVIEEVADRYIRTYLQFSVLPEEFRTQQPEISSQELDTLLGNMENSLMEFFPEDENYHKFLLLNMRNNLENQASGNNVIISYERNILRFENFSFDGNMVDVRFVSLTSMDQYERAYQGSGQINSTTQETEDQMILIKEDGQWKVIYTNFLRPFDDGLGNMPFRP